MCFVSYYLTTHIYSGITTIGSYKPGAYIYVPKIRKKIISMCHIQLHLVIRQLWFMYIFTVLLLLYGASIGLELATGNEQTC